MNLSNNHSSTRVYRLTASDVTKDRRYLRWASPEFFPRVGQAENLLISLRISRVRTSLQSCVSLYEKTGDATNPVQLCISIICLLTFQNGGIFLKCHGGWGRSWLTVALPAPTFLMHAVNLYIRTMLKRECGVLNSCIGATGWNNLSGRPRDLQVAEIIKTSFNGKTAFVFWRVRSVRHAH